MSKAVLIVNMPDSCKECQAAAVGRFCLLKTETRGQAIVYMMSRPGEEIPEWCPLEKLPEKLDEYRQSGYAQGFQTGWNRCIDMINPEG